MGAETGMQPWSVLLHVLVDCDRNSMKKCKRERIFVIQSGKSELYPVVAHGVVGMNRMSWCPGVGNPWLCAQGLGRRGSDGAAM